MQRTTYNEKGEEVTEMVYEDAKPESAAAPANEKVSFSHTESSALVKSQIQHSMCFPAHARHTSRKSLEFLVFTCCQIGDFCHYVCVKPSLHSSAPAIFSNVFCFQYSAHDT